MLHTYLSLHRVKRLSGPRSPVIAVGFGCLQSGLRPEGAMSRHRLPSKCLMGFVAAFALAGIDLRAALPSAPVHSVAIRGDGDDRVSFVSSSDSSLSIKNDSVVTRAGGGGLGENPYPLKLTGITDGTSYTFTVTATTAATPSVVADPAVPIAPTAASPIGTKTGKKSVPVVRIMNTVIDSAGYIYLAGYFNGKTLLFGGATLTKMGAQDLWVAKLNPDNTLIWIKNFGGSDAAKVVPNGLVVDAAGAIHIGGFFNGSSWSTPSLAKISTMADQFDAFVLKLDSDGNTLWTRSFGGESASTTGSCIAVDVNANVYLGGYFEAGDLTVPVISKISRNENWDSFVVKLSGTGETLWAKKYGGVSATTKGQCLAVDASENVYFSGQYNLGQLTEPALNRLNYNFQGNDAFLLKIDRNGQTSWSRNFGGKNANTFSYAMTIDEAGFVYLCGAFMNGSMTSPRLQHTNPGHKYKDAYVFKLDSQGSLVWAYNYGGSKAQAVFNSISLDSSNNVYLSGFFKNGDLAMPKLGLIGKEDMLAVKLDRSGKIAWAKNFGGKDIDTHGNSIASDAKGNVYLGGLFDCGHTRIAPLVTVGTADEFFITAQIVDSASVK